MLPAFITSLVAAATGWWAKGAWTKRQEEAECGCNKALPPAPDTLPIVGLGMPPILPTGMTIPATAATRQASITTTVVEGFGQDLGGSGGLGY